MKRLLFLSFLAMTLLLPACGGGGGGSDPGDVFNPPVVDDNTGGNTNPDTTPATIILSASKPIVKPDNTDEAEIAAHVLSAGNVLLPGVTVNFSTNGGALNSRTATTDLTGKAKVKFTSGATANGTEVTISATAGTNITDDVLVQVADLDIPSDGSSINAFPVSIKSDGIDSSLVTFTVVNTNGAPVANIPVTFATDSGAISAASATTDGTGKVTTLFNSGLNKRNRTAKVSATAGNITKEASIQVIGSTLTLSPNIDPTKPTVLPIGAKETLTVVAKDAAGKTVSGETITFAAAGTGGASLSTQGSLTDVNGQAMVEVTGITLGTVTLTVQGLGVTATKTYEVTENAGSGGVFRITAPGSEQSSANLDSPLTITVSAPSPTAKVLFASTLGRWANNSNVQLVDVVGGTASASLTSTLAGVASISASDPANPAIIDSISVSFSAAANTASKIALQSSATVMATTVSNDAKQEVQLTATVKNNDDQVVGGAPVAFSIFNPIGGGEYVSPPVVYTNSLGQAASTFTSGVLTSPGIIIRASLADFPAVAPSSITITIGGEAGSITLGRATEGSALSPTAYKLPMSALVSDGTGGPAKTVPVSLTVWPTEYLATDGIHYPNEDTNGNLSLDAGEDRNCDGQLTPPASTAGNIIPSPPINTDVNGLCNFDLIYLKANYSTRVRVKATATVSGTETTSSMEFLLPYLKSDEATLPAPTFGPPSACPAP